jgi:hypothetical protein
MFICLFPGSRVTTDQRVVAKREIQEVEPAKRAGAPYAHHRNQKKKFCFKWPSLLSFWGDDIIQVQHCPLDQTTTPQKPESMEMKNAL